MHIKINGRLNRMADDQFKKFERLVECLLHSHVNKHHCFCPTPRQIQFIQENVVLGAQSRKILEVVSSRAQEYSSSAASAERILQVEVENAPADFILRSKVVHSSLEWAFKFIPERPFLFVENEVNDGDFYSRLVLEFFSYKGGIPPVYMRAYNGGGNTLGDILTKAEDYNLKGLSLCDRDTNKAVPPFVKHTTGDKAYRALVDMDILKGGRIGFSEKNPFYAFHLTSGWSAENYIGPHQSNVFLAEEDPRKLIIEKFTKAFPGFPYLSEEEMFCWLLLDSRHDIQSVQDLEKLFREFFGKVGTGYPFQRMSEISLPSHIVQWVCRTSKTGRSKAKLRKAFIMDMKSEVYRRSVEDVANFAHALLAADPRMSFS